MPGSNKVNTGKYNKAVTVLLKISQVNTHPVWSSSNAKLMGLSPVLVSNSVLYETSSGLIAGNT